MYDDFNSNIDIIRRNAISVNSDNSPVFEIEFSKFEHVGEKRAINIDGYTIYVYTPEMIVFEKLRAICQQLPEYGNVISSFRPRARARDFYDIYLIMDTHNIDLSLKENVELIKNVFDAKKVPLYYINEIRNNKDIHADNWQSVIDTVSPYEDLRSFDYYFDFVVQSFEKLTFL